MDAKTVEGRLEFCFRFGGAINGENRYKYLPEDTNDATIFPLLLEWVSQEYAARRSARTTTEGINRMTREMVVLAHHEAEDVVNLVKERLGRRAEKRSERGDDEIDEGVCLEDWDPLPQRSHSAHSSRSSPESLRKSPRHEQGTPSGRRGSQGQGERRQVMSEKELNEAEKELEEKELEKELEKEVQKEVEKEREKEALKEMVKEALREVANDRGGALNSMIQPYTGPIGIIPITPASTAPPPQDPPYAGPIPSLSLKKH